MRLTINLDDDLYAMARAHAFAKKMSISKAVGDLLRTRTAPPASSFVKEQPTTYISSTTGLLVNKGKFLITNEDVERAIDDDDLRHLEAGGFQAQP